MSISYLIVHVYGEHMGDLSPYTANLREIYIHVCGSILYMTDAFLPPLQLVLRLPLVVRLLVLDPPQQVYSQTMKPNL